MLDAVERRRYYRVDDRVSLKYRPITEQELQAALTRMQIGYPDKLSLASAFASTSAQMKHAMERFRNDLPEVSDYLEGLNEKLDLLVQLLAASDNDLADAPTHRVNLSASGMSFRSSDAMAEGSTLEIKLLLFPSYTCILAFGKVVHCSRDETTGSEPGYRIGVDFSHIRQMDRELIIKHVTQKQSSDLREARINLDENN